MEDKEFIYAGFWKRFLAYIIDQLIINIAQSILIFPVLFFMGLGIFSSGIDDLEQFVSISNNYQMSEDHAILLGSAILITILVFGIIATFINWLYYALMESSPKQATLGKMALGLKVVDENGMRISFARASGRFFGKILSGLILNIGFIIAGFTAKKQALHDILANCLVIVSEE